MARETVNNFYPEYKLNECADKEREVLSYIHFENGYAYASNGRVAIRAKIEYISTFKGEELELLEDKSIGMKEFKALLEYENVQVEETGFNRQQEFKFPDAENIVEQTKANLCEADEINSTGLDVTLLNKLSKSMGETVLRFDFNGNGAILVRSARNALSAENITGIIMPVYVDDESEQ